MQRFLLATSFVLFPRRSLAAFYYPNPQVSFLEHILVDNWGAHASNFSSAITPCHNYVTEAGEAAANSGRTTAAQWMRVAFHDFVTANVTAGTGGIEASIGFETLRDENTGSAFNDSFTFWRPFVNDAVPMADLVAMGTVMAMDLCGGHNVPYYPGRVDALEADPTTGVPAPETSLEETLLYFNRSGFDQSDSIALTACGHTMGSVHHAKFPQVVPASAVTANNTNGGINFDSTRAVFDSNVVHEYVDWTGNKGGPLVSTDNVTTRSDLRLYVSDGNATMRSLYDIGDGFQDTCVELMGRMINTVPSGVSLQDAITPMAVKPVNVTFDFDDEGSLVFSGNIRILTPNNTVGDVKLAVARDGRGSDIINTLDPEPEAGRSIYGATTYYPFHISLDANITYTSFRILASGLENETFPIQSSVFVVPSMTAYTGTLANVTIAARLEYSLSSTMVTVTAPIGQEGTLGPKIIHRVVDVGLTSADILGAAGFQLWQGSVDLGTPVTGAVSVNISSEGTMHDILYLDAGVAGW